MVLPTFASSCIAPDRDGINAFLFGVSSPGTLEAHRIILSDPLSPTSILISTTSSTETVQWDPSSSLGCYPYLGDAPSSTANSTVNSAPFPPPITIIQFGNTLQTQFYPNGTWLSFGSTTETSINYLSPKLFSLVGSTNGWNWILARTVGQPISWRHIRIGTKTEAGSLDLTIAGSEPLLSVGAIAPDVNNFGNGLFLSIDQSGSTGTVYRSTGNKRPAANLTATDTLVTLGKPTPLNMGNITLTVNAVPVTSAFAAFILDKNEQGTISVYSIDPRISTFTLGRTLIKGISPLFQSSQSFTSLNSKIVVYGGAVPNAIHIFDVISGTWTGPALVDSSVKSTSKGLSIGVIGGIAAAAVIVLIIGGFAIWRIRRQRRSTITSTAKDFTNAPLDDNIKVPIKDETIDLSALNNKNQPKLDEHKETSESFATLTQSIAPSSMPGTPASQHRRHSNHKRPEKVSRHASAYSMRSERSASHISLFSANSTIYLAGPATIIPPNPTVPSAYSAVNLQQLQNAAAVYRSTSAPGTPNPRSATPPSRKGSIYQVAVPNDYDDRQPLHHHETSEERQAYLQMSAKSTPDGSPASINGLQPLETASSTLDVGFSKARPSFDINSGRRKPATICHSAKPAGDYKLQSLLFKAT
ncbi:hypothetical protein FBU30_005244 [Linnemannia zychae]|nr:hypothetical protein FBU30_005244 [Linnemannia zychae]